MAAPPSRRSRLLNLATKALPTTHHARRQSNASHQPLSPSSITPSPSSQSHSHSHSNQNHTYPRSNSFDHQSDSGYSDPFSHRPLTMANTDDPTLVPPIVPFSDNPPSSRRSSFFSEKGNGKDSPARPASLSINYVPSKFTKLHAPGDWAHRRAKTGGGRDAFAKNASRMGMVGTVDDDEGVVFQLGKGGLKKKKPKLRWNRFKWILFITNSLLMMYGMAALVSAILVWLNVFYQSDVIRVGNRVELILSTIAASLMVLTSLIGFAGILLNNRAFLAVYTLLLWACLAFLVAPGYMTYKQRTFNLEGKINLQWSRKLGAEGRLRVQDALRCCGYFSPYVEATVSPLCYARSNFPGCKSRYLRVERDVLQKWYIIAFVLVIPHILIIVAALLCSNHITYRFGKGLTPKRYRLDMGSMAVIMDEYAGQIAAQYGPSVANEAYNRSSLNLVQTGRTSLSLPNSRRESVSSNLNPATAAVHRSSRLAIPQSNVNSISTASSVGWNSHDGSGSGSGSGGGGRVNEYGGYGNGSGNGGYGQPVGVGGGGGGGPAMYDPSRGSFEDSDEGSRYYALEGERERERERGWEGGRAGQGVGGGEGTRYAQPDNVRQSSHGW